MALSAVLKQSTTVTVDIGPFVDSTDGNTDETGLTIAQADVRLAKNGGNMAQKAESTSCTHDEIGIYTCPLDTDDTDTLGILSLFVHEAGALPVRHDYLVVTANIFDTFFSTDQLDVNVTAISGDSTTADNLETLFNGNEGFYTAYMGPRGPGVFFDDTAANTNTVNGVDGTIGNPVSSETAAQTVANSLNFNRIYLVNDSVLTLAQSYGDDSWEFIGIGDIAANSLALGGQNVDQCYMENLLITGAQGGNGRMTCKDAGLSGITALDCLAVRCAIVGSLTVARDSFFDACWSAVAGNATPVLDINSVANIDISWRHYSGGLQIDNAVATTTISYETIGQIIVDASCTSLALTIRGDMTITDNGVGTVITQGGALNRDAIADAVWDEAVDGAVTARQSMRLQNSGNGGKVSGAGTTNVKIRDLADTKDRVDATVDSDGNRTAVTRTLT